VYVTYFPGDKPPLPPPLDRPIVAAPGQRKGVQEDTVDPKDDEIFKRTEPGTGRCVPANTMFETWQGPTKYREWFTVLEGVSVVKPASHNAPG